MNTEELKIIIEYFHEIDKNMANTPDKFINFFISTLINKIQNCDQKSQSQLEITLKGVEKCLNENIFMDELIKKDFKDEIDKCKVEFLSLIKFPFFQEVAIKILFAVLNLEVLEKEILLEKFSLRKLNAKGQENKQDMSNNNLLLFNSQSSDDSKINNKPATEQDIKHSLTELKDLTDRKQKNLVFNNDEIQQQIQENNTDKFLTNNMKDNIFKIIDTINDGIPLLLVHNTLCPRDTYVSRNETYKVIVYCTFCIHQLRGFFSIGFSSRSTRFSK